MFEKTPRLQSTEYSTEYRVQNWKRKDCERIDTEGRKTRKYQVRKEIRKKWEEEMGENIREKGLEEY